MKTVGQAEQASGIVPARSPASQRVLSAGIDLFAEVGFLAATIRDITRACDLTAGAFYNHFDSKDALLHAIVSSANSRLEMQLDALRVHEMPPRDALWTLMHTLVMFNLGNPKESLIANREYRFLQTQRLEDVIEHRRRVRALFEDALTRGAAAPLLNNKPKRSQKQLDIRLLAISIINLAIASPEWFDPNRQLRIDEVADASCRLALRMAAFPDSG